MSPWTRFAIAGCLFMAAMCVYWTVTLEVGRVFNAIFAVAFVALAVYFWSPRRRASQAARRSGSGQAHT